MEESVWVKNIYGIAGVLIGLLIREVFALFREEREVFRQEAGTLHDALELNYLGEEINKNRQKIDQAGGLGSELPTDDENYYQLAKSLQQAGARCLLSTTSLEHVLLLNAPQVVRDWVLVSRHVTADHMRDQALHLITPVPFQRRHGEWLALVAFMWIKQQHYQLPEQYKAAVEKFESLYKKLDVVLKKENEIFSVDSGLISENTKIMRNRIRDGYMKSIYSWPKIMLNKTLQRTIR